ncbi:MAG: hypothetical protein ACFB0Z_06770 [Candidatus Phaeomarinobacter sp.]
MGIVALRFRKDIPNGPGFNDLAVADNNEPVTQFANDAEGMGDEKNRQVFALLLVADQVEDVSLDCDIKGGRRFISNQQVRVERKRNRIMMRCN